jgi:diketogulonate reductase-like aldo/keto reductase
MGFVPLLESVTLSHIDENADLYDFELMEEMKSLDTGDYTPVVAILLLVLWMIRLVSIL